MLCRNVSCRPGFDLLVQRSSSDSLTRPAAARQVYRWSLDILSALQHLHCLDPVVIHRDLKPANIILTCDAPEARLKLIDFGLAKRYDHHHGLRHVQTAKIGTPMYAAPEIFQGQVLDDGFHCCDMY